jgi:hypothetical protein
LMERPATYENKLDQGFLKLRPKVLYMPITEENLAGFAGLSEMYAEPEVCSHLRVYRADRLVLSWHDLPSDPFYVAGDIDQGAISSFCKILGSKYIAETV